MFEIKTSEVTPLGIHSLIISGVVVPFVAWLVKNVSRLVKKTNQREVEVHTQRRELDKLQQTSEGTEIRVTKLEDAVIEVRSASQRLDEQYATIMVSMRQVDRMSAQLDAFAAPLQQIVPRYEVEARMKNAEERIKLVEGDIRDRRTS